VRDTALEDLWNELLSPPSRRPIGIDEEIPHSDTLLHQKRDLIKYASAVIASHGNLVFVEAANFEQQREGLMVTHATTPVQLPGQPVHVALKSRLTEHASMIDLVTTDDVTPESLWRPLQRVVTILPHDVQSPPKTAPITSGRIASATTLVRLIDQAIPEPLARIPRRALPTFISPSHDGREYVSSHLAAEQIIDLRDEVAASKYFVLKEREERKYGS